MNCRIKAILPDSAASPLNFQVGDRLLAVNRNDQLEDQFDYQFEVLGEAQVSFLIERDGQQIEIVMDKDEDDDPGLVFESPVFTPIKTCNNACPFCFIDQQPEGLRASLYVKDDDWRLSYFCNTYITLTNLTQRDRQRMEMLRPGPLYVSVHSTVPEVRQKLLMNPKAGEVMKELSWLKSLDIPFHAQVVLCPGINDGDTFSQTLRDLASLRPACESVAVVPVGLTQHRGKLPDLNPVTQADAEAVIDSLQAFWAENPDTKDFAFASDEFYVLAGQMLPSYDSYGEFPQLDDGVGTARLLTEEFFKLAESFPAQLSAPRKLLLLTGELGGMVLGPFAQRFNQIENLYVDVLPIKSQFWGEAVTVAGLITGQDILTALYGQDVSGYDAILIPETMVRPDFEGREHVFLDGMDTQQLSDELRVPFAVVSEPTQAASLVKAVFQMSESKSRLA